MDPSITNAILSSELTNIAASYRKLGYLGEGAYGVVLKCEYLPTVNQTPQFFTFTNSIKSVALISDDTIGIPSDVPALISTSEETKERSTLTETPQPSSSNGTPNYVALKQMNSSREGVGIAQDSYREMKLLRELSHPNIVSLHNAYLHPKKREVDLVYSYAEHDLADIIRYHRQKNMSCDPRCIKSMLYQILRGMEYLHSNWIMHRDMKPANIFITGEKTKNPGTIQIGDFGLARIFRAPLRRLTDDGQVVTIWYRAPELVLGTEHYTSAVDIWAIGCIFYELIAATPLFPGEELKNSKFQESQMSKICYILGKPTLEQWPQLASSPNYAKLNAMNAKDFRFRLNEKLPSAYNKSSNAFALLCSMLTYDPSKRITASQALQHPYFVEAPNPHINVFKTSNGELITYQPRNVRPLVSNKNKRSRPVG